MESTRQEFDSVFSLYIGIAIVVAVLVFGAIFFVVLRYRARAGEPRESSRRVHANLIEVVFVLAVTAVIAVILPISLMAENEVDDVRSTAAVRIDVTGFQWGWRFRYPEEKVQVIGDAESNPTFAVPVDQTISFSLRGRDVIHSFWVPDQRFKRDAIPGRINRFDLRFDQIGTEEGLCAEFCGLHHTDMRFSVDVMSDQDFQRWILEQREGAR